MLWLIRWNAICHLRNVQDLLADGKAPYERLFGEPFEGPLFFWSNGVECHPISARDQTILHHFGKTVSPVIFLGYVH